MITARKLRAAADQLHADDWPGCRPNDSTFMCLAYSLDWSARPEFEVFAVAAGLPSISGALFATDADQRKHEHHQQSIRFMFLEFMALMLDDDQRA